MSHFDTKPNLAKTDKVEKVSTKPVRVETTSDEGLSKFLKLTGFKEDDIQGWNAESRVASTIYGQKFQMKGKEVRKIMGGGTYPNAHQVEVEVGPSEE